MVLKYGDVTVGHIPKFLSKIMYFYIKNGGELLLKITSKRQFSTDLPQGGLELPALCIFKSTNSEAHSKFPGLVPKVLKECNGSKKDVKNMKNKKKK